MKKGCTKVGHIAHHTPFYGGKIPIYNMAFKYTNFFLVWFMINMKEAQKNPLLY
jgi:hypothetical protein